VTLLQLGETVTLRTAPGADAFLEKERKEELSRDLGKAALETLAIVLYKGPVSRSDIDYIRGVNSTFILRSLAIRGLVERVPHPRDQRAYLYKPTPDLLGHLGIRSLEELPEYQTITEELRSFKESQQHEEDHA